MSAVRITCLLWLVGTLPDAAKANDPTYLRARDAAGGGRVLEVACRTLSAGKGAETKVTLLGACHLGEAAYYEAIQKRLDAADLVLFEGVGMENGPPRTGEGEKSSGVSELQTSLARSMGLVFQLEAVRYDRPHFRNSDVTPEELVAALRGEKPRPGGGKPSPPSGEGETGAEANGAPDGETAKEAGAGKTAPKTDRETQAFLRALSGDSIILSLASKALKFFGRNPQFRALMKLAVVEMLGAIEGDVSRLVEKQDPGMKRLMKVLLEKRNVVVFRDLRKVLAKKEAPGHVVLFYGAAHMADLEERITSKLGFRFVGEEWLPAFGVNPKKEGLTAFEVGLVRKMISAQMARLQAGGR